MVVAGNKFFSTDNPGIREIPGSVSKPVYPANFIFSFLFFYYNRSGAYSSGAVNYCRKTKKPKTPDVVEPPASPFPLSPSRIPNPCLLFYAGRIPKSEF